MEQKFYVYLLVNNNKNTYIGMTNNPKRRIRQHNGIIKGGAKCTKKSTTWRMHIVVGMFNKKDALRFERLWKRNSHGLTGRFKRLVKLLLEDKWKDIHFIPRKQFSTYEKISLKPS